jgi:protein-tyrosine phosphatase
VLTIPLVDTHCHLLAGLDDGPRTAQDVLRMCRIAWSEGIRAVGAVAHIGERWPDVTPQRIRDATQQLATDLRRIDLPLSVFPVAEVMARPDLEDAWTRGELLSMADRGRHLLVEMPAEMFVDLRRVVCHLGASGVRPVLAHPERHPELLHHRGVIEQLVRLGCLVQVSADSVTQPPRRRDLRVLRRWVRQGIVHVVGSDGHSPATRPPRMAEAYRRITRWAGSATANRICSTNGLAVLAGLPVRPPKPHRVGKRQLSLCR